MRISKQLLYNVVSLLVLFNFLFMNNLYALRPPMQGSCNTLEKLQEKRLSDREVAQKRDSHVRGADKVWVTAEEHEVIRGLARKNNWKSKENRDKARDLEDKLKKQGIRLPLDVFGKDKDATKAEKEEGQRVEVYAVLYMEQQLNDEDIYGVRGHWGLRDGVVYVDADFPWVYIEEALELKFARERAIEWSKSFEDFVNWLDTIGDRTMVIGELQKFHAMALEEIHGGKVSFYHDKITPTELLYNFVLPFFCGYLVSTEIPDLSKTTFIYSVSALLNDPKEINGQTLRTFLEYIPNKIKQKLGAFLKKEEELLIQAFGLFKEAWKRQGHAIVTPNTLQLIQEELAGLSRPVRSAARTKKDGPIANLYEILRKQLASLTSGI